MIYLTYAITAISFTLALFLPIRRAYLLAVFLMPFLAFAIYIGASVTTSQFVAIIVLIRAIPNARLTNSTMNTFLPLILFVMWGYVAAYSTLEVDLAQLTVADGSFFRNGWGRVLSQTVVFMINFGLLYVFLTVRPTIDVQTVAMTFIWACIILVAVGYVQVLIFLVFGQNIIPIGGFSEEYASTIRKAAILNTPLGPLLRMSSLGGEPKSLALSLVVACAVLIGFWRFIHRSPTWKAGAVTFLFSGIVLTGSTSGFFTILIVGSVMTLGFYMRRPLNTIACAFLAICISLANYGLFFSIVSREESISTQTSASGDTLSGLFTERTIKRFSLDDTDTMIINSLAADPLRAIIGRGMGLSHIGADAFLSDYYIRVGYYYDQIINAKSGLTNYGGMAGIVGLILLSIFFGMLVGLPSRSVGTSERSRQRHAVALQMLAFALFAVMLNRLYASNIAWLFIAFSGHMVNMLVRSRPRTHANEAKDMRPRTPGASFASLTRPSHRKR